MFFKGKIKEIDISDDPKNLIYVVNLENDKSYKKARLNVGTGCQAGVYYNGRLQRNYLEGSYELDLATANKKNDKVKVIGMTLNKEFKISFGIGGIPFRDHEAGIDVLVGIHGECDCRLLDGNKIHEAFGEGYTEITADDISDKVFNKLTEHLGTEFAKKLEDYSYHEIFTSMSSLSDILKEEYFRVFRDVGIDLRSCSIDKPYFPEDYIARRADAIENKFNSKPDEEKILKDILNAKNQQTKDEKKTLKCEYCNQENDANTKYCIRCGRKLNK